MRMRRRRDEERYPPDLDLAFINPFSANVERENHDLTSLHRPLELDSLITFLSHYISFRLPLALHLVHRGGRASSNYSKLPVSGILDQTYIPQNRRVDPSQKERKEDLSWE